MSEHSNGNAFITRDFKFATKRKTMEVYIPELEKTFRLRALSIAEAGITDPVKVLALMIVDEHGQRIFTTEEDYQNLSEMPLECAVPLSEAARKLSGQSKEAIEETRKNLQASQSGDSAGV